MKVSSLVSIFLVVVILSGCSSVWEAKYGPDKPHISFVSLAAGENQPDKLYVWNPNNNAAYIFQNTGSATAACLASADVAKSRSYESELKIDLGKVLDKVDSAKIEDKLKIINTVTKLSEKGESASFLNVAMFHGNPPDRPKVPEIEVSTKEFLREEVKIYLHSHVVFLAVCAEKKLSSGGTFRASSNCGDDNPSCALAVN